MLRCLIRGRGWEFRQLDPDLSLDTYLWFLLPHHGVNTVLDVGACHGEFGVKLRNNDYRGHIVSFEPVSSNFAALESRCARDRRWSAHHCAIGDADGVAEINVSRATNLASFQTTTQAARDTFAGAEVVAREAVPIRRLDGLIDEAIAHIADPHVYLKIDTQGWDVEVLRGAAGCLNRIIGLQTEVSLTPLYEAAPTFEKILRVCRDAGFELTAVFPVARVGGWWLAEVDCVMLRRELFVAL